MITANDVIDDIRAIVRDAMSSGYDSFKTNVQLPGDPFKGIDQGRSGPHARL